MKRKVIALTGGIGSGKSEVAKIVRSCGYETVDCDDISKQVASRPQVISKVESLLGSQSVVDGKLDRKYIRNVIFADKNLLNRYNEIFFTAICDELNERISNLSGVIFVEIPLLDAFQFDFDEVWLVKSNKQNRVSRVVSRDGVDEQNVINVMSNQTETKNHTRVIENDGTLEQLHNIVANILTQIVS